MKKEKEINRKIIDNLINSPIKDVHYEHTYSTQKSKPLTLAELKKVADKITVGSTGKGKKKGLFERFMNKLGWYRLSEWYILDSSKFYPPWGHLNKQSTIKPT